MTDTARDRLIVALDFPDAASARELVAQLEGTVATYKIGLELSFGGGIDLAHELLMRGNKVFLDIKLLDIGNTVERATANIARIGVSYLTVHGHDRKTLDAAVRGRGSTNLKLLAVTVMTNLDQADLSEQGIGMALEDLVVKRACAAKEAGFDGVIASAHEAANIRSACGPDFLIVTPGIRPAAADMGDQTRVMTPSAALKAGASHIVVGRPITQAGDPRSAAESMLREMT